MNFGIFRLGSAWIILLCAAYAKAEIVCGHLHHGKTGKTVLQIHPGRKDSETLLLENVPRGETTLQGTPQVCLTGRWKSVSGQTAMVFSVEKIARRFDALGDEAFEK